MGKSTISMAIFKSYVSLPEGIAIHSGNPYQPPEKGYDTGCEHCLFGCVQRYNGDIWQVVAGKMINHEIVGRSLFSDAPT